MKDRQVWLRAEWDRVAACVFVAVGAIVLFLGYQGISGSAYVAEQLAYLISGGIGGLFLLGVGATLFLSADLHDEWRKLDDLEAAIRGSDESNTDESGGPDESSRSSTNGTTHGTNGKADLLETASAALARSTPTSRRAIAPRKSRSSVTPPAAELLQMRAAAAVVCGIGALAVTWYNASGSRDTAASLGDVSRSAAVLLAVGVVLAIYLGTVRREVGRRSVRVAGALSYAVEFTRFTLPSRETARDVSTVQGSVVLGRGMSRYHLPGCPMLGSIKPTRNVSVATAAASAQPCELCNAPRATVAPEGTR